MGIYIYSVRTKNVVAEIEGQTQTIYALGFLSRSCPEWSGKEERGVQLGIERCHSVWERRNETPKFVFLAGGPKDNKPEDGAPVYEWDGRPCDYDTPKFEGQKRTVGFLCSRKQGRKTVWTVEPTLYSVTIGTVKNGCNHIRLSGQSFFSGPEAAAFAHANTQPGETASVDVQRADGRGRPAIERVAAPTAAETEKVINVLLNGPWPVSACEADRKDTADALLANGSAKLYHEVGKLGLAYVLAWGALKNELGMVTHDSKGYSRIYAYVDADKVVFGGGASSHSLCRGHGITTVARIKAHWDGYVSNNQEKAS